MRYFIIFLASVLTFGCTTYSTIDLNGKWELIEIKGYFRKDQIDKSDSLTAEYLIGTFGGSFGTYGNNGDNFIIKYFETNKNHTEHSTWTLNNEQDELISEFRSNCK